MGKSSLLWGVDYYPEQWPPDLIEPDARKMRKFGVTAVRMMEFAWALIEPEEGRFDFSFFDQAIDVLARHDIQIVLGTPTATFPRWLYDKDPDLVQIHPSGVRRDFGARRQACFNSTTYRQAATAVVQALAQHYGQDDRVIGWQIDNEVGHEGSDRCICQNCRAAWPRWLKSRYTTVDAINEVWGTNFWSTTYQKFEQIPQPGPHVASDQNPTLILDYNRFCSESTIDFVQSQVTLLRKYIKKSSWITTNLYPPPHGPVTDMATMTKDMDFAGFDNYPIWGEMDQPLPSFAVSYMMSYIRGLRPGPFAVMEQMSGIQGHQCLGALPPARQVALWTNQAIAQGADKIFYFRWRTARTGQEQLCHGLLEADDEQTEQFVALQKNIKKNGALLNRIAQSEYLSSACLFYDKDNSRLLGEQHLSKGLWAQVAPFLQAGYDKEMARHYAPFSLFGVNVDVRSAGTDLEDYRLISLPLSPIVDAELVEGLTRWVSQGGHLLMSWGAGTRDRHNRTVERVRPGLLADLAGVHVRRFESLNETKVGLRLGPWIGRGEVWADILEPTTARPLGHYFDWRKHYSGEPCYTVNHYGQGRVYYVGTSLGPVAMARAYWQILREAGLQPRFYGLGLEVIRRGGGTEPAFDIILNHTGRTQWVRGKWLEPHGMLVLPA
jgi:beta-galactosidase